MNPSIADRFLKNPALFHGKKILVVGDIALDRTFFCDSAPVGRHAIHAGESIVDVRPGGDDFGAIGAAYNACLLSRSTGAESVLITVTGDDPEGDRVGEIAGDAGARVRQIRLPGVQTVTRLRFYVSEPATGRFRLLLRVDKDPDSALSYARAEAETCTPAFLDWWEREVESSDAILFSDTGKGFLSRGVLVALDQRTRRVSGRRVSAGRSPILVVVDPKRDWEKFTGLKVDVFKPNDVEASGAVQLPRQDLSVDANLGTLAERIAEKYARDFPTMVITLGEHGAALIRTSGEKGSVYRFPALPVREPGAGIAMHCGDMFAAALTLSLSVDTDVAAAIPFANYVASLQVSKPIGQKIAASDLADPANREHFRRAFRAGRSLGSLDADSQVA